MVNGNDFRLYADYLAHYGVKGMHWGIRRYQNPDGTLTSKGKERYNNKPLESIMKDFSYDSTNHKLRSPEETAELKRGNCHDQVLYEIDQLKKSGKDPKAKFLIEVDSKTGQGGQTHSYVYYKDGEQYVWFENAWGDQAGTHKYDSEKELHDDVMKKFRNNTSMDKIYTGNFNARPGDTLQDIVNKSLK